MKNAINIVKCNTTLSPHGSRKRQSSQQTKKIGKNCLVNSIQRPIHVQKPKLTSGIGCQPKILLVEDNFIAQTVNKRALEQAGYTVETTETGEQTLNKVRHTDYSLIFMDIDLPDISGIEVVSIIRKNNSLTPIIALTTSISDEIKERCFAVGMNDFANKPISGANLGRLASQYCSLQGRLLCTKA